MILAGAAGADEAHPDELPWPPDEPPSMLMILTTFVGADPLELPPKLKKLACAAQKQRARTTNTFMKIKLPLVINQKKKKHNSHINNKTLNTNSLKKCSFFLFHFKFLESTKFNTKFIGITYLHFDIFWDCFFGNCEFLVNWAISSDWCLIRCNPLHLYNFWE